MVLGIAHSGLDSVSNFARHRNSLVFQQVSQVQHPLSRDHFLPTGGVEVTCMLCQKAPAEPGWRFARFAGVLQALIPTGFIRLFTNLRLVLVMSLV